MDKPHWIYYFGHGQADAGSELKHLVGGKGASLADMTRAGLNVPPGFTISAECCDLYHKNGQTWPDGLVDQVHGAIAWLERASGFRFGASDAPLVVAVRSGAAQSMPGMMDTVLNVGQGADPWAELTSAIDAVFRSWNSERAVVYRRHHSIDGILGTAVNVQMMCPSEVSGVMFTLNPVTAANEIVIESAYGLGEAVVLGKVTPDRFILDKGSLTILDRTFSGKEKQSLDDTQLVELSQLGQRVENHFGHPCDIEWGYVGGRFYLLQSRPIKLGKSITGDLQRERETQAVRQEEIAALRAKIAPGGTVWSRFNLAEVLPEPTPMTWSIVKKFMSGKGGFGQMYRDLGFDPDPALDEDGMFDLICGRPYCNLSREPRMQYRSLPFEHKFALLKANPAKALYPQAVLNPAKASWKFWLFLPTVFFKLWRANIKLQQVSKTFADEFETKQAPAFDLLVDRAKNQDLHQLSNQEVLERLHSWIQNTLFDFGRASLKPTALAAVAMGNLERTLAIRYQPPGSGTPKQGQPTGLQKAQAAIGELVMGAKPPVDADVVAAICALGDGTLSKDDFLSRFGHRGSHEMELAVPRWAEDPDAVARLTETRPAHVTTADHDAENAIRRKWDQIAADTRLTPPQRRTLEGELVTLKRYLGLREAAKHYLMRGYALIRQTLVELDHRYHLNGGIFFLSVEELPELATASKQELLSRIAARKRRRELALSIPVPQVLFSDDLQAIGRAIDTKAVDTMQGVGLSAGVAEGVAWVLNEVEGANAPASPYVLVCPSTDPAWVPLFSQARGLVMETGGVLSHGAIVAREFGLPAVAGIADVHRLVKTGQVLQIDGTTGKVMILTPR